MRYKYPTPEDFKDVPKPDFHKYSGNLILYGAGVNGLIASVLLKNMGVEFICFADSDSRKWGTEYVGKTVISPKELKERYPDVAILITPFHLWQVYQILRDMGYSVLLDCLYLFMEFDSDDIEPLLPDYFLKGQFSLFIDNNMRKLYRFHVSGRGESKALFIFVTEQCTLRCKNCLYFMPYYTAPKDYNFNTICSAIERLLKIENFDFVSIVGGETFLYGQLPELIDMLAAAPNIYSVLAITNGTILPDRKTLNSLRNEKVMVRISDYGDKSTKIDELEKLLDNNDVNHSRMLQKWYSFDVQNNRSSDEDSQAVYASCCKSESFPFLMHDKLYKCAFAAHLEILGVLRHSPEDCVDLLGEPFDEVDLKSKVNALYKREEFIQACRYCRGMGYLGEEVPIAEQVEGVLPPLVKRNNS